MLNNSIVKILIVGFVILLMILLVAWSYSDGMDEPQVTGTIKSAQDKNAYNFLVWGKDNAAHLCDVIILVSMNTQTGDVNIMQIPRDTYFNYTENSYKKINGAPNTLGNEGFVNDVSESMGIEIDNYLALDLDAVSDMVDHIGGVDIDIPADMDYDDPEQNLSIHFKAGKQKLNGVQAVEFLRYRSGYVTGDLGRIDAQKIFLNAFADKLASLGNPFAYYNLFKFILGRCETDITEKAVLNLVIKNSKNKDGNIYYMTAPGEAVQSEKSGAWYYVLSKSSIFEILQGRFGCYVTENDFDKENKFVDKQIKRFYDIYNARYECKIYTADDIENNLINIH